MKALARRMLLVCLTAGLVGNVVAAEKPNSRRARLKVVVFAAHPGDAAAGCGGLIASLVAAGHDVTVAYASTHRGDRQIGDELEEDVRQREAQATCKALGAEAKFFGFSHEELEANEMALEAVSNWLLKTRPDVIVTHWPLDTHRNHHVVSSLVWQCYRLESGWSLYFFETMTGRHTVDFAPNLYLDVASVRDTKRKALECNKSQKPGQIWRFHDDLQSRRGREAGVKYAEAYYLVTPKVGAAELPVPFIRR